MTSTPPRAPAHEAPPIVRPIARAIGVVALFVLVTGCSHGLFGERAAKPAPSADSACAERCTLLKTQCRQRQEYRERACGEWYAAAKKDDDQCRSSHAAHCRAPDTCLGADMGICDRERDGCVAVCGGPVPAPGAAIPKAGD